MGYRKSASDVRITITGTMLYTVGGLIPIKDTTDEREVKLNYACPECQATKVNQLYVCPNGCQPLQGLGWTPVDLPLKGRDINGVFTVVDPTAIEAAKASPLEKGLLAVDVRPADVVALETRPGAAAYWFEATRTDPFYGFLVEITTNPDIALVGLMNLRGQDKLYKIEHWGGGIVLQELLRPQDVRSFPVVTVKVGDAERAMGEQLVAALLSDFNPDDYASDRVANLRAAIEAAAAANGNGPVIAQPAKKVKQAAEPDMTAMLAAALAAATAGKKTA